MRMNISVPDDLKARMDAVKEDVNWSALACRAFKARLGIGDPKDIEIAAIKKRLKRLEDDVDYLHTKK